MIVMAWPKPEQAGAGVFAVEPRRTRIELLEPAHRLAQPLSSELPPLEPGLPFDKKGITLLEAVGYTVIAWFNTLTTNALIDGMRGQDVQNGSDTLCLDGLVARIEYRW